ncbi:hypothetical protein CEXT_254821 [Caerostris extrusa]|uniref:Uncharacterized protein n=1 Tax=Caerostris extrusa TaxID=172846 RepID=A0AAV4QR34_CAEEX|nr:hypothetical protein CEXT_254821 [Caerostris extrusa]
MHLAFVYCTLLMRQFFPKFRRQGFTSFLDHFSHGHKTSRPSVDPLSGMGAHLIPDIHFFSILSGNKISAMTCRAVMLDFYTLKSEYLKGYASFSTNYTF